MTSRTRLFAAAVAAAAVAALAPATAASADPSADAWWQLRQCESGNNYSINTGNAHYGAYQFDLATWRSVGGSGYPYQASKAEQDARALVLYRERGWQPWQCASILGLKEDADARSGRISDIHIGSGSTGSTTTAPPYLAGSHWFTYGEHAYQIKRFQDQMHARGFFPVGNGVYGPSTLVMVKQLQRLNGLIPNGDLGPNTWATAWEGTYTAPAAPVTPAPPTSSPTPPTTTAPPFLAGSHWYTFGEHAYQIKRFQDQMHARGFFPVGTGVYGPNTLTMIKQLQRLNGLIPNGFLGPKTWATAWTGRYTMP